MPESARQELIAAIKDERARTKRVLDNFPASSSEMKPHETSKSARELAHVFSVEAALGTMAVNGTLDLSKMGAFPPAPATWSGVVQAFDAAYDALLASIEQSTDADMASTVTFMTGPKQTGPMRKTDLVRFMLNDHIHHRGQLSVYLRMSGGKVPSIYGPSKDEPWR
jgi:uncharacterized damage-inducible protein DinB